MKKEKSDKLVYDVPADWTNRAHVNGAQYDAIYALSAATPDAFWSEHGKRIDWIASTLARYPSNGLKMARQMCR